MESFEDLWALVKEYIKANVTEVAFKIWINPIEFVALKDDVVTLTVNDFKKKIILDKFYHLVVEAFENVLGFPVEIEIISQKEEILENENEEKKDNNVNEYSYTFDNFIIGSSNKFAHAAALNVANNPGKAYNPLFIYGHSGLGKTHLLSAIMNEIKSRNPKADIIYTSGEHFTNELIYHIGNHNTHTFHEKYRNTDVLLVDDIQFIAKTETTQEEFFHTFNALNNSGKQIVLTSDRPPKEMMTLEERLRTRFESGLIADVQPPSLETRMAIVKKKSIDLNIDLNDEIIQFIAENIKRNVRQLEGTVKKIKAVYDVEGIKPNIAIARKAISDINNSDEPPPVTVEKIIKEVSRALDVNANDIRSGKRNADISHARQVSIYIVNEITDLSLKAIGNEFGQKHYTTVIYALNQMKEKIENNINLRNTIDDIIKNINDD